MMVDRAKRQVVRKIGMPASVVGLAWHHRLNQVFVGIGELACWQERPPPVVMLMLACCMHLGLRSLCMLCPASDACPRHIASCSGAAG